MTYKVILEKCGRTIEITVKNVKSEGEAIVKAIIEADEGFSVSRTVLIG